MTGNGMAIETPWSTIGYLTMKRTYSRVLPGSSATEEFEDIVERVVNSCRDQLNVGFSTEEEDRLRSYMLQLKGTVCVLCRCVA